MPSKMEAPESAKTITVFVNGDSNYNGKERFEINWNEIKQKSDIIQPFMNF